MTPRAASFLLVEAGGRRVGLPVESVEAVVDVPEHYPVPSSASALLGLVPARNRLVPLFSLARLLHGDSGGDPAVAAGMGVVMRVQGRVLCLRVDDALAIIHEEVRPVEQGAGLRWASGLAGQAGDYVPVLDLELLAAQVQPAEASGGN
jgi:chemotaxis signal transduction protein